MHIISLFGVAFAALLTTGMLPLKSVNRVLLSLTFNGKHMRLLAQESRLRQVPSS